MFKKTLLAGAVALSISSVAFASGEAPSCVSTFSPGWLIGLQAGYGLTGWNTQVPLGFNGVTGTKYNNAVAGRVYVGYDAFEHFAFELGYVREYPKTTYQVLGSGVDRVLTQAVDLLVKIKAPITDSFGVFAKVGAAYLMSNFDQKVLMYNNVGYFNVAYGLGFGYDITSNLSADLTGMRYAGRPTLTAPNGFRQPNFNTITLGLAYKFNF